jgi:hypothetical protein
VGSNEDLSHLKKFLKRASVAKLKHDYYITYDKAVLWICYGVFADARSNADSLERTLSKWANRGQENSADGYDALERFQLAFEQLQTAVRHGRLHLIAKYWIPGESDLVHPEYIAPKEQYQIITAADLAENEIEEVEDGQYSFGEHTIELLLVPYAELEIIFGSMVRNLVQVTTSVPRTAGPVTKMGRRRSWDWDWLYVQIVLLANQPDGLPKTEAELERWAENRFLREYGVAPDPSHIRKKIAPIYQARAL